MLKPLANSEIRRLKDRSGVYPVKSYCPVTLFLDNNGMNCCCESWHPRSRSLLSTYSSLNVSAGSSLTSRGAGIKLVNTATVMRSVATVIKVVTSVVLMPQMRLLSTRVAKSERMMPQAIPARDNLIPGRTAARTMFWVLAPRGQAEYRIRECAARPIAQLSRRGQACTGELRVRQTQKKARRDTVAGRRRRCAIYR